MLKEIHRRDSEPLVVLARPMVVDRLRRLQEFGARDYITKTVVQQMNYLPSGEAVESRPVRTKTSSSSAR